MFIFYYLFLMLNLFVFVLTAAKAVLVSFRSYGPQQFIVDTIILLIFLLLYEFFFKTQHDTTFYSADPSIDREFLSENKRNIKCIIHGYKIKIDEMLRDQCFSKENLPIKKSFVRLPVEYIFAFLSYHLCYFRLTQRLFISCLND